MDKQYAEGEMADRVDQFKRELFGRDDLILHTADIARNRNGFERLKETAFRQRFYDRLSDLMRSRRSARPGRVVWAGGAL